MSALDNVVSLAIARNPDFEENHQAAAELAELRAALDDVLPDVKMARRKLRATHFLWQKQYLFDCDEILTSIIEKMEAHPKG